MDPMGYILTANQILRKLLWVAVNLGVIPGTAWRQDGYGIFFTLRSIGGFSDFSRVVYMLVDCVAMFVLFYRFCFPFFRIFSSLFGKCSNLTDIFQMG